MRECSFGTAVAAVLLWLASVFFAAPLLAQQQAVMPAYTPDPHLNPEDQLAPSQIVQPMPAAVPEPGKLAIPKSELRTPARRRELHSRHAEAAHAPAAAAAKPARREPMRTVIACSGPFAKDSGMLALAVEYGSTNMIFKEELVQGAKVGATVLFPKDPRRRLEVWWQNPNRTGTYLIDIAGKSIWTAPGGVRLGLSLAELQKLNRKPFKLKGFDENSIAGVIDWDGGALAALPGGCKAGVSLHTKSPKAKDLPEADQYSSEDNAMRALDPRVSEILIGY